jgi:putative oxidoreductase
MKFVIKKTKMKMNDLLRPNFLLKEEFGQLITRITIATVMWPHGAQLLLGLFGGQGFANTMAYFTDSASLPWLVGLAVILIQFFGSLFILVGFFTRINAFAMAVLVIGMIFSGHTEHGFFMNWFGNQAGEGYEFHLLLLGLCISLLFQKQYRFSLDTIMKREQEYEVLW